VIGEDYTDVSVLKEMTEIMSNCGGKFIEAVNMNQMEEEIMNLAVYNI